MVGTKARHPAALLAAAHTATEPLHNCRRTSSSPPFKKRGETQSEIDFSSLDLIFAGIAPD